MHPLIGLITIFTVLLLAACTVYVGRMRGRYGVKAPAMTGPEGFERAVRVQGNTNEAALMFLPALWVAAHVHVALIAAALGALWLVARIWYALAYANPPRNRGPGFALSVAALVGLVLQALWGLAWGLVLS
jgi:glutathione S-transferase